MPPNGPLSFIPPDGSATAIFSSAAQQQGVYGYPAYQAYDPVLAARLLDVAGYPAPWPGTSAATHPGWARSPQSEATTR